MADRVARLRPPHLSRSHVPHRASPEEVAEAVGGSLLGEGLVLVEQEIPLDAVHGGATLAVLLDDHSALPEAAGFDVRQAVFIDTETTGLSGGTGTTVFLLGMGRLEDGALRVRQYLLTSFAGEAPMYADAAAWLGCEASLVSFNGKCFDVPLLSARCRLAGAVDPFGRLAHLDLLHPTRRAFGSRWSDCRLATAEVELLAFFRDNDLPGAEAPAAWFSYIHAGDGSRLPAVMRHNHWDIVSLAALLPALAGAHRDPRTFGADVLAVARMALRNGEEGTALDLLSGAEAELDEDGLLELARIHRRRESWEEARGIWERLAGCSSEAVERLAKYHEHVRRDYETAMAYTMRLPPSPERERRCRRLAGKMGGGDGWSGAIPIG